ncbi:hypothetical protein ABB37_04208 [Leptomonas pyrrhocoris]|uniref:Uncharacterized protein n=1 Tax=Leptomonas pyrrhocoris TaxID=157538 RepID=A0A0N0DVX4_LEPPY|nr:hypothetical protein ABB37_04208 [Leptomonas pyrrhocoris]KPA80754.1 hypothetical protein ABB37_04208 [Leptomonas pyrrhocoris]|eukprot:XP_015659193.1 hypothetical protein ABB37_04208 [Leptomonas pyrrhocoris]
MEPFVWRSAPPFFLLCVAAPPLSSLQKKKIHSSSKLVSLSGPLMFILVAFPCLLLLLLLFNALFVCVFLVYGVLWACLHARDARRVKGNEYWGVGSRAPKMLKEVYVFFLGCTTRLETVRLVHAPPASESKRANWAGDSSWLLLFSVFTPVSLFLASSMFAYNAGCDVFISFHSLSLSRELLLLYFSSLCVRFNACLYALTIGVCAHVCVVLQDLSWQRKKTCSCVVHSQLSSPLSFDFNYLANCFCAGTVALRGSSTIPLIVVVMMMMSTAAFSVAASKRTSENPQKI